MQTAVILLTAMCPLPDLSALGDEDWRVREAEMKRLDNPLSPLLLPPSHPDPEVDLRVKRLRTKNLKWCDDWSQEQLTYRRDYRRWFRQWWSVNRSKMPMERVWRDLISDKERAAVYVEWGLRFDYQFFPLWDGAYPLEDFQALCHFHWQIAPHPTEVGK